MNGRFSAMCGCALIVACVTSSLVAQTREVPNASSSVYQVLPYECHEGNLAIVQGLGGERAEDKALEEDAKRGIIRPRRPIQGGLIVGGQPIPEGGPR